MERTLVSQVKEQDNARERVLVIEDEGSLRRLLALALRRHGYDVMEAEAPGEAIETWKANRESIDLVISDIVMPGGQNGWELARLFWQDRPSLKVLFMSGYFGDLPPELNLNEKSFIRKPFMPMDLISRVRFLLDA